MNPSLRTSFMKCSFLLVTLTVVIGCGREPPAADSEESTTEVVAAPDSVPIRYTVHGTGSPTLVFVHGWMCDKSYWEKQLLPFSQRFEVVAVDLAGHGESGLGRQAWTIASFGDDVAAVVKELGLEHVVLIGHSMGGDVKVEAARRLPGRVDGLVWIDTYSQLGKPRTAEQIQAFLEPFRSDFVQTTYEFVRGMFPPGTNVSLVEWVARDMSTGPPEVGIGAISSSFAHASEIIADLEELNLPVIAINPDNESTDMESMKRHGVEVVLLSGVGHFMMMEDPERFNSTLMGAVDRFIE